MSILADLYFGNLTPFEKDFTSKEQRELSEKLVSKDEKFRGMLDDAQTKEFEAYLLSASELQCEENLLSFEDGFKLGSKIMMEVLKE